MSTSAVRIKDIAFTGYPVTDLARARAFYEGVLGLKSSVTFEHGGAAWIEYDVGPSTLAISNMMPAWKPSADGPSVAFEVENFEEAVAALRDAQVSFLLEPSVGETCSLAVVADPDGNGIAIHQKRS
ncbi:MAG TPA: VOC family protein [Opitutus sp.]|nr:VOC family protein [Opitutus sp.]